MTLGMVRLGGGGCSFSLGKPRVVQLATQGHQCSAKQVALIEWVDPVLDWQDVRLVHGARSLGCEKSPNGRQQVSELNHGRFQQVPIPFYTFLPCALGR